MDLIFKRYSSPFVVIDEMILYGRFDDFITTIWTNYNDDILLSVYLSNNPYNEVSFEDFKKSLQITQEDTKSLEATVQDSYKILNAFEPIK